MGLLRSLFGNVDRDIERAESLLDKGETAKAIDLATRLFDADGGRVRGRAEQVVERATLVAVDEAEEKASAMEEIGHLDDAIEWLEIALARLAESKAGLGSRRPQLERRLAELRDRLETQAASELEESLMAAAATPAPEAIPGPELDDYQTLVDTLRDDVAALYEEQPTAFQRAVVALSQGEAAAAIGDLETLDEKDPLVALERGRARLLLGHYQQAREDFEAAWSTFGDEPLDYQRLLSLPLLWCDAASGAGDSEAIVARLMDLEEARWESPRLTEYLAQALIDCAREEEAVELLRSASQVFAEDPVFPFLLASVLVDCGDTAEAIDLLEGSTRRSARGGVASRLHSASIELLARLLIDGDSDANRAYELLDMAAHAAGGTTASQAKLRARLLRRDNREAEAEAAEGVADKLAALEREQPTSSSLPAIEGAGRKVL